MRNQIFQNQKIHMNSEGKYFKTIFQHLEYLIKLYHMQRVNPIEQNSSPLTRKYQNTRRPLLPFDQISYPQQIRRERTNIVLDKFIPNLRRFHEKQKIRQKQRLQILSLINDRSYQKIDYKKNLITKFYATIDDHVKIFKPDSPGIVIWNLFIMFVIFMNLIQIPLAIFIKDIVYNKQHEMPLFIVLNVIYIIGLFLDTFFVRFNLAFYRHDQLIDTRHEIFANYLRLYFWLDAVAWLSMFIQYICLDDLLVYIKLLFFLRVVTLLKIDNQVQFCISLHKIRYCFYKFVRVLLFMWFLTTWVSCIYFYIDYSYYIEGGYYYQTGQLWLMNSNAMKNKNLIEVYPHWYIWYQYAVYWSLQTSSGVGYGNMTPRNPVQVLYCNFIILLNTIFFAYFIRTIWQIIEQLQESYNRYIDNWMDLKQYLKNEDIPRNINKKIGSYLQELLFQETLDYNEEQFTSKLSSELSCELNVQIRGNFFQSVPIFQEISQLSVEWSLLLKQVVFAVQKQKIASGQQIYNFGDTDPSLFYLVRGKVGINVHSLNIGGQIYEDKYFGMQQFVTKQPRLTNAITLTFSIYWKLSEKEFRKYLTNYPNLYYKYCQLVQRVVIHRQVSLSNTKCLKCGIENHQFIDCPQLNSWRTNFVKAGFIKKQLKIKETCQRETYMRNKDRTAKIKNIRLVQKQEKSHQVYNFKTYRNFFNID